MTGTAGNKGDSVRSDCYVTIELTKRSGIEINLQSRVAVLYGNSIKKLCKEILNYFDIEHAKLSMEDTGALDFVIAARMEAAIKQLITTDKEYLFPFKSKPIYPTRKERSRRSRLYLPGNTPKVMVNAGIHGADGIILDLEDSVAPQKKEEARILVRNALRSIDFFRAERMVRINQVPEGLKDLPYIIPHMVNLILIPKCESATDIKKVNQEVERLDETKLKHTFLMPILESSKGIENASNIAAAAKNVLALAIGLEDYTADIGVDRTEEGSESVFARTAVVNAANAAGIQAIDSIYSDIDDLTGLEQHAARSKGLGFVGMGCIHPRQIKIINSGFNPCLSEINKAQKIVLAYEEAEQTGSGVVALDSKMIDLPVVKRALHTIEMAMESNLLPENWREEEND